MRLLAMMVVVALVGCGGDDTSAPRDTACVVGDWCGNECLENDDACWACGELTYDAECNCRPAMSTCVRPDCSDTSPGQAGDYCGTYWWCDRACAAGLQCADADTDTLTYVKTCQV